MRRIPTEYIAVDKIIGNNNVQIPSMGRNVILYSISIQLCASNVLVYK